MDVRKSPQSTRLTSCKHAYTLYLIRDALNILFLANFRKLADGLFLEATREIAKVYPFIKYEEMIIDNCSMQVCFAHTHTHIHTNSID